MRGKIEHRERRQQIIDFSGLRWGNITPTDIDGVIDFGNRLVVYLEYKLEGIELPFGQELALERQCDNAQSAGIMAAVLVLEHNTSPDEDIIAADCPVRKWRYLGKWRTPSTPIRCKEAIDKLREVVSL